MKMIVLDGYTLNPGDLSWAALQALGACEIYDRTSSKETLQRAQDAEILLTNKTVLTKEPADPSCPLLTAKNCVITPHIAWATRDARARLLRTAVDNLKAFLKGDTMNVVN
jgi:hypothetical protein